MTLSRAKGAPPMQNVLGVMFAVGVPQKAVPRGLLLVRAIPPPAAAFKSIVVLSGGVSQVVGASVTPLMMVSGAILELTTKFENRSFPAKQPLGGVTGMADRAMGEAGQPVAQAGAASARGITTIKNRLNINVFFIY